MSTTGTAVGTYRYACWDGSDPEGVAAWLQAFSWELDGTTLMLVLAEGYSPTPIPMDQYLMCRWHIDGFWSQQETIPASEYAVRYTTGVVDNAVAIADLTARVEALEAP